MTPKPQTDSRLAAMQAVGRVLDERAALGDPGVIDPGIDPRDAAFARRLAYGVLRWYSALDWLAQAMLDHPLKPRDADVQRLILLGIYQLWKEDVAPHAAVHATAGCATRIGKKWAVGLVNALLRRFQREHPDLLARLENEEARHAHPAWLLDRLRSDWPDNWPAIVEANNQAPPLWLRCPLDPAEADQARAELESAGHTVHRTSLAPGAWRVEPPAPVQDLPGFQTHRLSVQDLAAQLAAPLLDPQPGERVLDACAAPGGKATHLLQLQPGIELTALDLQAARIALIAENLERLGLTARVQAADASRPAEWWDGVPFQKILLDAPCSATGVIRRHPEIKWLRSPDQVHGAQQRQADLLDALWPLLDAGGMLVYATCSVLKSENTDQVAAFLDRHPDARCVGPEGLPGLAQPQGHQVLPGQEDMDGFYYAQLRKAS